jgi:hypothetical protein
MYVLSKRSALSENGLLSHSIYGSTPFVGEARAWFRASTVTDVIEVPLEAPWSEKDREGNGIGSYISEKRLESWREQQHRQDLEMAKLGIKK